MMSLKDSWQGTLIGTLHTSPNGVATNILDIKALNPQITTIYYLHPHLHKSGGSRQMTVTASPVEVYKWLRIYKHVNLPETLVVRIEHLSPEVIAGLLYCAQSELGKESIQVIKAYRIDPWYFADIGEITQPTRASTNQFGKPRVFADKVTHRLTINGAGIDLIGKMGDSKHFADIDHDALFEYLQQVNPSQLARLWALRPDYFMVLKTFSPDRWEILHTLAQLGLTDF